MKAAVNEKDELITVIVPVYNVERYLEKCVYSICKQSYDNLQIILVDDGSTDSSAKICDKLAEHDNRICVVHKTNGGMSDARNHGLELAEGQYITFVDSDDYIAPDMCFNLYSALKRNRADIAMCGMTKVSDQGNTLESINLVGKETAYTIEELVKKSVAEGGWRWRLAWAKLYTKDIWKTVRFRTGKINEDEFAFYRILLGSKKVVCVPIPLYYYLQRAGSIMSRGGGLSSLIWLKHLRKMLRYFSRLGFTRKRN